MVAKRRGDTIKKKQLRRIENNKTEGKNIGRNN
jgi:hypothetical protein